MSQIWPHDHLGALHLTVLIGALSALMAGCDGDAPDAERQDAERATPDASRPVNDAHAPDAAPDPPAPDAAPDSRAPDAAPDSRASDAAPDSRAPDAAPDPPAALADIVDAAALAALVEAEAVQVVDVRSPAAHAAGHVPGALWFDAGPLRAVVDGIGGQAVAAETAWGALTEAGIDPERPTVVVGGATEPSAARVAWGLRYYGMTEVGFLDGGFGAWAEAGQPAADGPAPAPEAEPWIGPIADRERVDADWVLAHLDDPQVVLVDARSAGEFAAGRIPGARSVDWQLNTDGGVLRPDEALRALYRDLPAEPTLIAYCQSGTRASVTWLVLRHLGYADVRVYDGSWAEWSSHPDLPREAD